MKHKRFEENILIDEAYTNYGQEDKNADTKKGQGIASHFAQTLEYDERKKWYHQLPQEPPENKPLTQQKMEELRNEASSALHSDTVAYETKSNKSSSSDQQWAKTLLNKGAIGDRVAAATVLIQDNPLYNLTALRNLINNVKPAKKRDGIVIIDALSELLISELLIPNAKLRTFEQHALSEINEIASGNKQAKRNILKLWYYEDQLKELYGTYVEALNNFAHDSVEANKEKAVSAMSYLLMHHPEREKMLLSNIINKLGDPSQAVSSKVIYHLCQLLFNHPNMKSVVLLEIEKMLFRPNISTRAQYYGICFLNQFFLHKDDTKIAENLIRIYFSFFKASIKKGEIDTRLMSAILTGVKRAYPFTNKERLSEAPQHIDAIHKLVHLSKFNIAIHALALLFQISDASKSTSDRYYTALYRKLTNPEIFNTSHSALLFSLIYKSLKKDNDLNRVTSFVKRLLQLCCSMVPAQACGMLFMISQVLKDGNKKECMKLVWTKKEIKEELSEQDENIKNETELVSEDNDNHSVNSLSESVSENRMNNKKNNGNNENSELKMEVKRVDLLRGNKQDLLNDDDDEVYVDLKIDDEGNVKPKKRKKTAAVAGWFHATVKSEKDEDNHTIKLHSQTSHPEDSSETGKVSNKELKAKIEMKKAINMDKIIASYDPLARNPSFAGAMFAAFFELLPLANHFHPTLKLFAEKLLNDQVIHYSGDPLIDFSGVRFLDRFVFKNPKKRTDMPDTEDGLKKVKGSHPKFAMRKNYTAKGLRSLPVNSASYLNEDATRIPVDEKFLYDFLRERRTALDSDAESDSDDSVTSEDFERYLDSMTKSKTKDDSDDELDYLSEVQTTKQRQVKAKKQDEEKLASDADDDDDEADLSDGELEMSADEDEPSGLSGDEEELLLEGSDEEDEIEVPGKKTGKKNKLDIKVKGKDDLSSLFASAEEFSTLLEETATNKKQGSSQAVSNTDNASLKQLAWEDKRDRWIKGYNKKILGNKRKHVIRKNNKNKTSNQNSKKMLHTKQNQQSVGKASKKGAKRKGDVIKGSGGKRKK